MTTVVRHRSWGRWPSILLVSDAVELEVVAEVGARVISLRDRQRERDWLVSGDPPSEQEQMTWASEGAVFGGRESFGWDECLPTTSVCADPLSAGGATLRDHGDQWGRGAYLGLDEAEGAVSHTWSAPRWPYRLRRRLSFEDERTVVAQYQLQSLADTPLPLHWAQHPVLRLEPGSHLELPGGSAVTRSSQHGIDLPATLTWPLATTLDGRALDLARVTTGEGWAAVLYTRPADGASVVTPDGARLRLEWDQRFAPWLRIWLSYGGWPPGQPPSEQVALEPCTAPTDDLAAAMDGALERILAPRATLRWWTRMRLE